MEPAQITVLGGLGENTMLYRYVGLSQFMSFVETYSTTLTQVKQWQDTWEIPFRHVAVVDSSAPIGSGDITWRDDPIYEQVYGQCWSLNAESDAMWRIYSPNKEGLMIATTVKRFGLLKGVNGALLAPVIYYDNVEKGRDRVHEQYGYADIVGAFLKRKAFEHEREVRLATLNNDACLGHVYEDCSHIRLSLNPMEFITEITIDPRASGWYVETIQDYCERAGFATIPVKSSLYSPLYPRLPSWVIEVPQDTETE